MANSVNEEEAGKVVRGEIIYSGCCSSDGCGIVRAKIMKG